MELIKATDEQLVYKFANGYGASVIQHKYSYGYEDGLFELAVLKFDSSPVGYGLCYDSGITSDVLGYLTMEDVEEYMRQIEAL